MIDSGEHQGNSEEKGNGECNECDDGVLRVR